MILMAEASRDPSPKPSPRLRGEGLGEGLWFNRASPAYDRVHRSSLVVWCIHYEKT